jgi:hypothetical protein
MSRTSSICCASFVEVLQDFMNSCRSFSVFTLSFANACLSSATDFLSPPDRSLSAEAIRDGLDGFSGVSPVPARFGLFGVPDRAACRALLEVGAVGALAACLALVTVLAAPVAVLALIWSTG